MNFIYHLKQDPVFENIQVFENTVLRSPERNKFKIPSSFISSIEWKLSREAKVQTKIIF